MPSAILVNRVGTAEYEFTLPADVFGQVRELADQSKRPDALRTLQECQIPNEAAVNFVDTLTGSPLYSVCQTVQQEGDVLMKRDFTLIQGQHAQWFAGAIGAASSPSELAIKTVTKSELSLLLTDWV